MFLRVQRPRRVLEISPEIWHVFNEPRSTRLPFFVSPGPDMFIFWGGLFGSWEIQIPR